jgi:hypothetical protein
MSGGAIGITSRILFLVCGLVSLATGIPYAMLRGIDLPVQSEWIIFLIALALVGLASSTFAVLPRSWIGHVCRTDRDDKRLFSSPLKHLGAFAALFYLTALVAYFAPHTWNLNPQLMFALCPMYFVKLTFDPSPAAVFLLLAPMNAAVYGALGVTLGCLGLAFRGRT